MGLFKRGPSKLERVLAAARLDEALERAEQQPVRYRYVHTRLGRIAHLEHPVLGVLCPFGRGAEEEADASLPVCRLCEVEAGIGSEGRAAS